MNPAENHTKPKRPISSGEKVLVKSINAMARPGCGRGHIVDSPFLVKVLLTQEKSSGKQRSYPKKRALGAITTALAQ